MRITLVKSHFWTWFEQNNKEFLQLHRKKKKDAKYWMNELSVHIRAYCKKLGCQINYNPRKRTGQLIITAGGDGRYFHRADDLVAKAPEIPRWEIYSLIPPQPLDVEIVELFRQIGVDPLNLWFKPLGYNDRWNRPGIVVYSDMYNDELSGAEFESAISAMIVNVLGERSASQDIGDIVLANLSEADNRSALAPLEELTAFVGRSNSVFEVNEEGLIRLIN
jgi:hypothetical protein